MKKVTKIQKQLYAYSTDNDDHAKNKATTITDINKAVRSINQADLEKIMDVSKISPNKSDSGLYCE